MAIFTMTLGQLIESGWDLKLNNYPIFDEIYRETLNNKIINHYYFQEIGFESPALFIFHLNNTLNEIMPYYNKLYETEKLEIKPLTRMDYSEEYGKESSGNSSTENTQNANSSSKTVQSETPQQILSINDIENNFYASFADIGKSQSSGNSNSNVSTTSQEKYVKNIKGNNANRTDSEMLMEYRKTFLNIDMMVIEDLATLFMCVLE